MATEQELVRQDKNLPTMHTFMVSYNVCKASFAFAFQGDSGGTLQYEVDQGVWVQAGIVSFGPDRGCGSDYPNGYSRISHLLDFISDVTGMTFV